MTGFYTYPVLLKRAKWQEAFTLLTCERQDLVMTRGVQGEILSDMHEKGECLGGEDATMNAFELLRDNISHP
jgi:hypothetical protein